MAFMSLFSTLFTSKLGKSQRVGSWLLVTQQLIAFLPWIGWVFIPTGILADCIYCAFLIGWLNAFFTGLQIGSEQITRRCHRLNSSAEPTTPRCIKVHNFFNWWWWEGNGWLISRTRCTFFLSIHSFKFVVNIWRKKRFFCPSAKLVARCTTKLKVRS